MPLLLFYFPMILFAGLFDVARDEMRVPAKVKRFTPPREQSR